MPSQAYEIPNLRFSAEASTTVLRRRFVKFNSSEKVLQAGVGESAIGVSTNSASIGEVLEIADGIVIVEAGGIVAANDVVQSDSVGRAAKLTTGIPLGTALSAASGAGILIAVKTPCAGAVGDVTVESGKIVVTYQVEDLAADGDIAARPVFVVPTGYTFEVTEAHIIAQGSSAGIDDSNTSVVALKVGATSIASITYNTSVTFPASGAAGSLGTISNATRAAGDVVTVSVTNGTAANTPAVLLQITGTLAAV